MVTPTTDTAKTAFGGQLQFLDATPDLTHVVLESGEASLLQGQAPGLYQWTSGGNLEQASTIPKEAPETGEEAGCSASLGDENANLRNALSSAAGADGTRIFFTAEGCGPEGTGNGNPGLFMRNTATHESLKLNAAQGVIEPLGEYEHGEFAFQGANTEGTKVFFTDTSALTPESAQRPPLQRSENNPADLYECQILAEVGKAPRCDLTDLTPSPALGSAEVLNVAPGISEDGSYVYFVANGALTPAAEQGNCEAAGVPRSQQSCNLYVWHEGSTTLIARLSGEDSGDWSRVSGRSETSNHVASRPDFADVTAGASPNGRYFAFMSKMPLSEYNNLDKNHVAEGIRDQEVYLYDAGTRRLVCTSCNSREAIRGRARPRTFRRRTRSARRPAWRLEGAVSRRIATRLGAYGPRGAARRPAPAALPLEQRPTLLQQSRRARRRGHQRT